MVSNNQGTRQGDPLSPFLEQNHIPGRVIDEILGNRTDILIQAEMWKVSGRTTGKEGEVWIGHLWDLCSRKMMMMMMTDLL